MFHAIALRQIKIASTDFPLVDLSPLVWQATRSRAQAVTAGRKYVIMIGHNLSFLRSDLPIMDTSPIAGVERPCDFQNILLATSMEILQLFLLFLKSFHHRRVFVSFSALIFCASMVLLLPDYI